jgi:3-hydroxyisobutyrate dehydrogenase
MTERALAVIGLGLMGSRMAGQLAAHGFDLRGFDTDAERMREFEDAGGAPAGSPAEAVQGCWAALLSLPDSDISKDVCLGPGGLSGSGVSPLYVYDATTGRPADAVEIGAALSEVGITYCDTTVSGNGEVAERGQLVVMVGGSEAAYRAGWPIFDAIGRSHHHVGEVGAGSRMKLLVNQALAIHRLALAETLVCAELAGLELDATIEVLRTV